jgi:2-dehydro-3-deoxyglucarate aldolase/4-hydroxy-2-oxoheptanedioate aldolase
LRTNRTKARLAAGDTVFGSAVQIFRSAEVARIYAAAGFDYVFIDTEHSGFDLETVQEFVAASVHASITPIVRVSELQYSLVARALDIGAQGIILPRVEDPGLLAEAISWTRFPPCGRRGFGVTAPVLDYEPHGMPEVIEHLNRNTLVVAQFETRRAMHRMDELLDVAGLDVAMIGPADLSISLGAPGDFDHPDLHCAIDRLIAAARQRQVAPGIQCRLAAQGKMWTGRGMRFVGVGSEHSLLLEKARELAAELKMAAGSPTQH